MTDLGQSENQAAHLRKWGGSRMEVTCRNVSDCRQIQTMHWADSWQMTDEAFIWQYTFSFENTFSFEKYVIHLHFRYQHTQNKIDRSDRTETVSTVPGNVECFLRCVYNSRLSLSRECDDEADSISHRSVYKMYSDLYMVGYQSSAIWDVRFNSTTYYNYILGLLVYFKDNLVSIRRGLLNIANYCNME